MVKKSFNYGTIQSIAIAYLVIWSISPPLEIDLIYRILALGATAIWAGIWLIRENPIVLDKNQLVSIFFLFTVIAVTFIDNGDFKGILKQIAFFMLVVCFIMNSYYKEHWEELRWLIPVVLILFIIWNYKTVQALIADPTIARRIVRDDEEIYQYLRQGVGGYSLVYPQVCISSAVLLWIIKVFKQNKLYFVIGIVWAISFVQLIAKAGYSIAIFTSVVGVVMLFFYKGKSGIKAFIVAAGLFALIMLSIVYVDGFREWLLEIFDGTAVAKKINDLVATSETGAAEGSIQARMTRYVSSIRTMVTYPIIGGLWRASGGGHSGFLDTIAKYGLWGGWFFIKSFYSVPDHYKKKYDNSKLTSLCNAVLVSLMIVSFLNSVTYSIYCVVLLVLPLFFEEIIRLEKIENENTVDS
jgi:hypothetical protein